jgi:enterochelin esterase family protein
MMRFHSTAVSCVLLALTGSTPSPSAAQQSQPRREPTAADLLVSPEVLSDRRIVFRIHAPKASEVKLRGDWMTAAGPISLQKDERGIWSATEGPLTPDLYGYTFTVDGVRTLDPKNPTVKPGIATVENLVFVPGPEAAFEEIRSVPHAEIRQVWYASSTLGVERRMHVYTPPGYDGATTRYPVFYLLHGAGDEDAGWSTIGRAGFIVDNLLAEGKARPMIVVMPNGSLPRPANLPPLVPGAPRDPAVTAAMQERFTSELLKDIVPFVERSFRALPGREHRAIAGLSMGGGQTLRVITTEPDKFAYAGIWSAGVGAPQTADFEKRAAAFLEAPDRTNKLLKLLSISVGDNDAGAHASAKNLSEILTRRGIKHELRVSSGAHTWINWRHYLHDYAQLLFRPAARTTSSNYSAPARN